MPSQIFAPKGMHFSHLLDRYQRCPAPTSNTSCGYRPPSAGRQWRLDGSGEPDPSGRVRLWPGGLYALIKASDGDGGAARAENLL